MRARMEDRENSLIYLSLMRGSAYEKGKEEGKKEELKDIIKNMLLNGISKENIIKFTGISEKDFDEANIN